MSTQKITFAEIVLRNEFRILNVIISDFDIRQQTTSIKQKSENENV